MVRCKRLYQTAILQKRRSLTTLQVHMTTAKNRKAGSLSGDNMQFHEAEILGKGFIQNLKETLAEMNYKVEYIRYGYSKVTGFDEVCKCDIIVQTRCTLDESFELKKAIYHISGLLKHDFGFGGIYYREFDLDLPTTPLVDLNQFFNRLALKSCPMTSSVSMLIPIVTDVVSNEVGYRKFNRRGVNVLCFSKCGPMDYCLSDVRFGGSTSEHSNVNMLQNPGKIGGEYLSIVAQLHGLRYALLKMDEFWKYQHITPEFAESPLFVDYLKDAIESGARRADPYQHAYDTAIEYLLP